MVGAQAEEAGDDLGPERGRRVQAGAAGDVLDVGGDVGEAEMADEPRVEAGDRDGLRRRRGLLAERRAQLGAGQRALAVKAAVLELGQQAGGRDLALLGTVPAAGRGGMGGRGRGEGDGGGED